MGMATTKRRIACGTVALLTAAGAAASALAAGGPPPVEERRANAAGCLPAQSVSTIVDDSLSMSTSDRRKIRLRAVELLLRKPTNQGRVLGAVEFGADAGELFAPGRPATDHARMLGALGALDDDGSTGGGSDTDYDAAFAASAASQPEADARIFLTDGEHNGTYYDSHRGGPRTYVVGLGIGPAGRGSEAADRLQRIAQETGGRYFPLQRRSSDSSTLQLRRLQPVINQIDGLLACQAAPRQVIRTFTRSGETAKPFARGFGPYGAMELVTTRSTPGVRCRLVRALVYDRRGRVIADLRGTRKVAPRSKRRRVRLDVRTVEGSTYEVFTIVRPRGGVRIVVWVKVRRISRPVPVTVQLRPIDPPPPPAPPAPPAAPPAPPPPPAQSPVEEQPTNPPPSPPRKVITVYNKLTNGSTQMREDPIPVRLTTKPWKYCTSRGCNINGTERATGGTYDAAVCQTTGDETTNGDNTDPIDDHNPNRYTSNRYYGVRLGNGTFGYVSEVWINSAHRGGLGLPAC